MAADGTEVHHRPGQAVSAFVDIALASTATPRRLIPAHREDTRITFVEDETQMPSAVAARQAALLAKSRKKWRHMTVDASGKPVLPGPGSVDKKAATTDGVPQKGLHRKGAGKRAQVEPIVKRVRDIDRLLQRCSLCAWQPQTLRATQGTQSQSAIMFATGRWLRSEANIHRNAQGGIRLEEAVSTGTLLADDRPQLSVPNMFFWSRNPDLNPLRAPVTSVNDFKAQHPLLLPPLVHQALERKIALEYSRQPLGRRDSISQAAVDVLSATQMPHWIMIPLQARVRGFLVRCEYHKWQAAALQIHRMGRGFLARRLAKRMWAQQRRMLTDLIWETAARAAFSLAGQKIHAYYTRLYTKEVLQEWFTYAHRMNIARKLFNVNAKATLKERFADWREFTKQSKRYRYILTTCKRKRGLGRMIRVFTAWWDWAHTEHMIKMQRRKHDFTLKRICVRDWRGSVQQRHRAATHIQAVQRGHAYRRRVKLATKIQAAYRGHHTRVLLKIAHHRRMMIASVMIQGAVRRFHARKRIAALKARMVEQELQRLTAEQASCERAGKLAEEEGKLYLMTNKGKLALRAETLRLRNAISNGKRRIQNAGANISAAERTRLELRMYFDMFDTDGSGKIDIAEFTALVNGALEMHLSQAELDALAADLDTDSSGSIEFNEFAAWFAPIAAQRLPGSMLSRTFDSIKSAFKDLLGTSGLSVAARQSILSRLHAEAFLERRQRFRQEFPPALVCPTCHKAFALWKPFAQHTCGTEYQSWLPKPTGRLYNQGLVRTARRVAQDAEQSLASEALQQQRAGTNITAAAAITV